MSIALSFGGWFQCRLPTDPDPSDEPRGVSGYVLALSGEPDLDRVLRLQPQGTFHRAFCPEVGVKVTSVVVDGRQVDDHPLVGADVDLLDDPVFEGRNGIVAEDGFEPIVPFHLRVSKGRFNLQRRHLDEEEFPFGELQATGVQPGVADIAAATGIYDLWEVWQDRKAKVDAALAATDDEVERAALRMRSRLLARRGLTGFFGARMMYSVALRGSAAFTDDDGWLPAQPAVQSPWFVDCWLGGWDADALCGYIKGMLQLELDQRSSAPAVAADAVAEVALPMFSPEPSAPRAPRRP